MPTNIKTNRKLSMINAYVYGDMKSPKYKQLLGIWDYLYKCIHNHNEADYDPEDWQRRLEEETDNIKEYNKLIQDAYNRQEIGQDDALHLTALMCYLSR